MPVPLVRRDGRWFFDGEAGEDEILARRIGENEIAAIEALKTFVAAERAPMPRVGSPQVRRANMPGPTDDGTSGIMTFIVGPDGRVLEQDLGEDTASEARLLLSYDPGPTRRPAER